MRTVTWVRGAACLCTAASVPARNSMAQQTATTAVGLELGSDDGLDGTIGFDGRRSRDASRADYRFDQPPARFPRDRFARGSDSRADPVPVTVGDHRTVCSPQPAAADRRPHDSRRRASPTVESRTADDADLAVLLLVWLRSRARRRFPTPRPSAEACASYDPRVSTDAREVAAGEPKLVTVRIFTLSVRRGSASLALALRERRAS